MVSKSKRLFLYVLVILSIGINVYFRLDTLFLHPLETQAKKNVFESLRKELSEKVSLLYPGLNSEDREKFLGVLFREYVKQNKQEIDAKVTHKSKELKAYFQDERGWTYLLETDPYRWFRMVKNYLNTGIFGTRNVNGKEYDDLRQAPLGFKVEPIKFHYYIGVYFYKILHLIDNRLTLANALALHPVAFSSVMVVAIFGISVLFGISYLGAFVASLVIGLSPQLLARSSFGWFDTDIYNIFMPLFIASLLAYSFKGKNIRNRISLVLGGLLLGVYSALWTAWWLTLYILSAGLFLYEIEIISCDRRYAFAKKIKDSCLSVFLFILSTYLSVLFISGLETLKRSFTEPFFDISLRGGLALSAFWPSMALYVSELWPSDASFISAGVGGPLILYGGLVGILLFVLRKKASDFSEKKFLFYTMFVWLLATLVLTWHARRFIILLVVPVAIFLGMLFDALRDFIFSAHNGIRFLKGLGKRINNLLLGSALLLVSIITLYNASGIQMHLHMNESWHNVLMKIKKDTPSDAIIDSWWDNGDFIMSVAERATLNDASWQYTPVTYWVAKALLSPDEEEAFGILRMLNSGSSLGFDELLKVLNNDRMLTMASIMKFIRLNEREGKNLLASYVHDNETLNKISKLIYGPNRPAYLIIDNRMIDYMYVLSAIANWDFVRLDQWQAFIKLRKENFIRYLKGKYGYSQEYSESIYKTLRITSKKNISSWISHASYGFFTPYSESVSPPAGQNLILFDNGIVVDKANLKAYLSNCLDRKWKTAGKVIFINGDSVTENINAEGDNDYAALCYREGNICKATMFSSPLAQTLFFKLYFMNGRGLKHFKLVHEEYKKGYSHIFLYKIE